MTAGAEPSAQAREAARRWGLALVERCTGPYHEVWYALRGDEHVVLKLGGDDSRRQEAAALRAYEAGCAGPASPACRLLAEAPGALLLERILLGDDLRPMAAADDDAATALAAGLLARLHAAARRSAAETGRTEGSPALGAVAEAFDRYRDAGADRIPPDLLDRAEQTTRALSAPGPDDLLLHGDLHHQNVLRHGVGGEADVWRAIDPRGWWGDPAFDTAAFMVNPHEGGLVRDHPERQARRRAAILAETTGLDRERILDWALAGAVIAELWCLADHGFVQGGPLRLARALAG
jgi:streptomycin 6-kinase